jgi:AcrR family transcriptional regulator
LLQAGRERLTTTRVAARAGVSVGTLYQYFPNKSALLQAVLRRHLDEVTCAVEAACEAHGGKTLREMAEALVTAFLQAKLKDVRTSTALYFISSGVDVASILAEMRTRSERAIVQMLESAADPPSKDPRLLCFMLQGAMAGVSRAILESHAP